MRIKGHKRNFLPEFRPTTPSTAAVGLKGYAPTDLPRLLARGPGGPRRASRR
jgi:hypothetical protein